VGPDPYEPVQMYGRYWEPYTSDQVMAVVQVLREVQRRYGSIRRPLVIGHEHVTDHKLDPGPLFPIHGVRLAMDEPNMDPTAYQWYRDFLADPKYGEKWRMECVYGWWSGMFGPVADNWVMWAEFKKVLQTQFLKPNSDFGILGRAAMQILGYYMPAIQGAADDRKSIEVFQRMMRLKVDGTPGIQTRSALVTRLMDRGILPANGA